MQGHRLRPGTRRAMTEQDYASLITAAHRYLNAPVIVIWDNLPTHLSRKMQAFTTGHPDWLTVIQLPAYAPDLNPVEGAWSVMKRNLANLTPGTTDQLAAAMRHQLDRIQRRPALITGLLGQTGLTLDSQPPVDPDLSRSVIPRRRPSGCHGSLMRLLICRGTAGLSTTVCCELHMDSHNGLRLACPLTAWLRTRIHAPSA